jgi:hypothetical protein
MLHKIISILFIILISNASLADDVLIIKNIKTSASNKNATLARNQALEKGQIKAFQELVKIYYPNAEKKASSFTESQIFNTVEGFKLSKEKRSATNYYVQMTVKFSKSHVNSLMNNFGAVFTNNQINQDEITDTRVEKEELQEVEAKPKAMNSLLIPVLEENNITYWIEDENKWLTFWQEKLKTSGSNQFTLPIGDLEDISLLNENMLNKNIIDLSSLYDKYSINNIALVKIKVNENESDHDFSLSLNYLNRFNHSWQEYTFPITDKEELNAAMQQYYQEMFKFKFKATDNSSNPLSIRELQTIIVDFPIENISDWSNLEQILSNITPITNVSLEKINLKYYRFSLTYIIEFEELNNILRNYRLTLQNEYNGRFVLLKGE